MKIRIKLAFLSILLSGATLLLCGALLLNATSKRNMQVSVDSAIADLGMLRVTYVNAVTNAEYQGLSEVAKKSLVLYLFQQYSSPAIGNTDFILSQEQKTLHNNTGVDPFLYKTQMIPSSQGAFGMQLSYCTLRTTQGDFILASTDVNFGDDTYTVSILRNITMLYETLRTLTFQYIGICLGSFALLALILYLATYKTLKPLEALKEKASQMVDGEYEGRITVQGNDEIASLTESFNAMMDAVQSHVQALKDTSDEQRLLIAALTHELKTPMTAIMANAETLERTKLNEAQRYEVTSYIRKECARLERLTQKMIRLIHLTEGEDILLKETPVIALFETVARTIKEICTLENISLDLCHTNQRFYMDIDLMASMCINLFDNARKAGASKVSIEAIQNRIVVTDNGQGIPEKELSFITQPFYMVDKSRSKKTGSIGLGLTLVNRIAQLHHASLSIQSQLNEGTAITFQFDQ
ncbi:HAMP domain-containing histidine kinase [Eubacteriales bacterium OttesenSCG-928-K08]|nr:HAMP domain-containing histidine kinase [Eubacteriales bacterium OttesenSCG-928-K08]